MSVGVCVSGRLVDVSSSSGESWYAAGIVMTVGLSAQGAGRKIRRERTSSSQDVISPSSCCGALRGSRPCSQSLVT